MEKRPVPHEKIVFVCTNCRDGDGRKSCGRYGADLRDKLKKMVKERNLKSKIRVSQSGCLDRCEQGPNIMVFPDNTWYLEVKEKDLKTILEDLEASLSGARGEDREQQA